MNNRKYYLHRDVIEISSRIQQGLPLVPNKLTNTIVTGCVARAQELYPVRLVSYVFESNHFHLMCTAIDPKHVPKFIKYVKSESAHAINRMLGRKKGTVWDVRYCGPVILDYDKALERLVYIYSNPVNDSLVDSVDKYPGVCSWKEFKSGNKKITIDAVKVPREQVPPVPRSGLDPIRASRMVKKLKKNIKKRIQLVIEPYAFMDSLKPEESIENARQIVVAGVRNNEEVQKRIHKENGTAPMGVSKLVAQSPHKEHTPKKFGKKMICLSSMKDMRIEYIRAFKEFSKRCGYVYSRWKVGDYSVPFPLGGIPPARPPVVCAISQFA
jgi:REP element-mobilizing transposase RayT